MTAQRSTDGGGVLDFHQDHHVVLFRQRAGNPERVGAARAGVVAGHERFGVAAVREHRAPAHIRSDWPRPRARPRCRPGALRLDAGWAASPKGIQ